MAGINISKAKMGRPNTKIIGEKHYLWKGDKAGYHAKHIWANCHFGRPQKCEDCGSTKKRKYEWANISKSYLRERSDWKRLCTSCHRIMDHSGFKKGAEHPRLSSKLTEKQVRVIKWALFYGTTQKYLAKAFKVDVSTVSDIKTLTHWQHVTI